MGLHDVTILARFDRRASITQGLKVVGIKGQPHVATVGVDMVYGHCSLTASPAVRFFSELYCAQSAPSRIMPNPFVVDLVVMRIPSSRCPFPVFAILFYL